MAAKTRKLIVGYDTETTGLENEDRVIEFAASIMDIDTGEIVYRFEQRFNSGGQPIHPKALAVHGIHPSDIAHCPDFATAIPTIQKMAKLCNVWLAHNAEFDNRMLAGEFNRASEPMPVLTILDSMVEGRWATPNGKNPNLGELCFSLGIPYDPALAHNALYDVEVMLKAWRAGWQRGFYQYPEAA